MGGVDRGKEQKERESEPDRNSQSHPIIIYPHRVISLIIGLCQIFVL